MAKEKELLVRVCCEDSDGRMQLSELTEKAKEYYHYEEKESFLI